MSSDDYDTICTTCFGSGIVTIRESEEENACTDCSGYGHHLTQRGRDLIEFLERRGLAFPMNPMAEEELRGMIE